MEAETLKKMKGTIEKCLEELAQKSDLTPAETKAAKDAMELRELLMCEIENCMAEEHSERSYNGGYYGHAVPYRQYHITSYGRPVHMSMPRYSGDYGIEGWYRGGDRGDPYCDPYTYNDGEYSGRRGHGYSRHSIGDRAVEKLEQMMDAAGSDYEREELHKFIRMIRQAAD